MGFRGDHTEMCRSGMWIILSWKQARLKRLRKNHWTSPLLLKEFKIEGLCQEVAITIDDYRKACVQCHREEALLISLLCVTLSLADSANICLQSIHSSRLPLNCLINTHGGKHLGMWTPGSLVDDCVLSHVWLCDPMDYTCQAPPSIGVSWARRLEWVAISFSRGFSQSRDQTRVSCVFCIARQVLYHWAT